MFTKDFYKTHPIVKIPSFSLVNATLALRFKLEKIARRNGFRRHAVKVNRIKESAMWNFSDASASEN